MPGLNKNIWELLENMPPSIMRRKSKEHRSKRGELEVLEK